jgi:hypothetical protein
MAEKEKKDLTVEYSEDVKAKMAEDPKLAAMMREMAANFRQAFHGINTGQYKNFEDAMEAITGERPQRVDFDD